MPRRVNVNIDSLVLNGFRFEDRHAIAGALQNELARLLAAPEIAERLGRWGETARLRVDAVKLDAGAKPDQVGCETARAIGKGLLR